MYKDYKDALPGDVIAKGRIKGKVYLIKRAEEVPTGPICGTILTDDECVFFCRNCQGIIDYCNKHSIYFTEVQQ